jgi:hypothetical protein
MGYICSDIYFDMQTASRRWLQIDLINCIAKMRVPRGLSCDDTFFPCCIGIFTLNVGLLPRFSHHNHKEICFGVNKMKLIPSFKRCS